MATIPFNPASTAAYAAPVFDQITPWISASAGLGGAVLALVAALYFVKAVRKESEGNELMAELRVKIYEGAQAFLFTQYKWLSAWVAIMFVLILLVIGVPSHNIPDGVYTAICFIIGSFASALSGYIGMVIATQANSRTTEACKTSISRGLEVSFASGAVMGNAVVGLGMLGLSALYLIFTYTATDANEAIATNDGIGNATYSWTAFSGVFNRLAGFGFGASTIGMFARVGGGVFTKAADVGSDLVGKVEQGIPEDDPRNPAVIADNVGDNVGDVAGMGADLFESYAGAVIATATLAPRLAVDFVDQTLNATEQAKDFNAIMKASVALPFWINGFGILASLIGTYYVRNVKLDDKTTLDRLLKVITNGVIVATVFTMGFGAFCVATLFRQNLAWRLFGVLAIGLVAGVIISKFTEYCTAYEFAPTREISAASEYGTAPVIIKGLGVGMFSVSVPAFSIAITIVACNAIAGQYGIAISAVGLLSTLGITLATDAFGPVADNAGGIAEMAGLESYIRSRTDKLDSLGNTTAATGKGLAIASATLTAVGLIAAFVEQSNLIRVQHNVAVAAADADRIVDLSDGTVLTGVLLGACLPYIFAALTMLSVDRGARSIITEVRLQFATAPLLMQGAPTQTVEGVVYPNSKRCVEIATTAAIQEMIMPGVLAVFVPICIGFLLGPKGTVGLLAGALGGCFMLALTMATSGGAWDNAKKWCEKCASEGEYVSASRNGTTREELFFGNFGTKLKYDASKPEENARQFEKFNAMVDEAHREAGVNSIWADMPLRRFVASDEAYAAFLAMGDAARFEIFKWSAERYHDLHSATVTGDTVGDPFKDTSGPALNVLIKTMTMMALMLAPAYAQFGSKDGWNGFGAIGSSIAAGLFVFVGLVTYLLVSRFRKQNAERDAESVRRKKEADRKYLAAGGAAASHTAAFHVEAASEVLDGDADTGLLRGTRKV